MEITVRAWEEGLSPLELLQYRLPAAPLSYWNQLLRRGKVQRDSEPLQASAVLRRGDILRLPDSVRLKELMAAGTKEGVEILFESCEILAVYKPAGLAVHRGVGHEEDNLTRRIAQLMEQRKVPFRTAPVHRLDVETSGPVLFGKGRAAAAALGRLFMAGAIEKVYLGLAKGRLEDSGRFVAPVPAKGRLKTAVTEYRVVSSNGKLTLLEMRLLSGRTHQIRRQLADAGHPLAGDRRYGGPPLDLPRLFLHCRRLALSNPFDGLPLVLDCALPPELALPLARMDLDVPECPP